MILCCENEERITWKFNYVQNHQKITRRKYFVDIIKLCSVYYHWERYVERLAESKKIMWMSKYLLFNTFELFIFHISSLHYEHDKCIKCDDAIRLPSTIKKWKWIFHIEIEREADNEWKKLCNSLPTKKMREWWKIWVWK